MIIKERLFNALLLVTIFQSRPAYSLADQFKQQGYVEMCGAQGSEVFDRLYTCFDELIIFLSDNPSWHHKLYSAKERFIRSKEKDFYSTDFFGFYNESEIRGRRQISFYYSLYFHNFIRMHYPDILGVPQIAAFFELCRNIQNPCGEIFYAAARQLGLELIFCGAHNNPPVLLKVIKYLASYSSQLPHYDGTAFSLFLDSTDNQSLLLSAYKPSLCVDDFYAPSRFFARHIDQSSHLLIPGSLLTEFSLYPTPHIVVGSGKTRYATIAFAMRPDFVCQKSDLALLPNF